MYQFSQKSHEILNTCDLRLQRVVKNVLSKQIIDITVLQGHRTKVAQLIAFQEGKSKLTWPDSKHNKHPSLAVDLAPYPINWKDERPFYLLAGLMMQTAINMDLNLRWGGAWNGELNIYRGVKILMDLPHFEVKEIGK